MLINCRLNLCCVFAAAAADLLRAPPRPPIECELAFSRKCVRQGKQRASDRRSNSLIGKCVSSSILIEILFCSGCLQSLTANPQLWCAESHSVRAPAANPDSASAFPGWNDRHATAPSIVLLPLLLVSTQSARNHYWRPLLLRYGEQQQQLWVRRVYMDWRGVCGDAGI